MKLGVGIELRSTGCLIPVFDPAVGAPAARGCGVLVAGAAWSWVIAWLTCLPASIWSDWRWVSMRDCFSCSHLLMMFSASDVPPNRPLVNDPSKNAMS